jgi:hypothetical protein
MKDKLRPLRLNGFHQHLLRWNWALLAAPG